jgi:hypothetical protein
MKKIPIISKILLLLILAFSIKFSGCQQEDLDFIVDCDNCLEFKPDSADLIVYVTINDENPFVPLVYYIGNYEDGIIDYRDTARTEEIFLYSKIGVDYTVKATYTKNGKPIVAVDEDKLRIVDGQGDCYSPCYFIRGGTLDVRLK